MQINEEIKLEGKLEEDITGVTCIYIPVKDVYESIKWYQKNLGCEPTNNNPVRPGIEISILRFPDHNGNFSGPGLRQTVPAIFLITAKQATGSLGFTFDSGDRHPIACFITPRIQEMYNRFKENGVNIVSEIPENRPFGPNFRFCDPDGNMLEIWQP
ncbi:VOC family protein [Metabacillus bambusae]|uniref:VOC family protein n=1 Tax=Metabacillus bambusae TaxID=2795218 RepID=A0ABS3MYX4_9BACI|nr:VOC family protein [Metabacillus bambusae]MBO1511237.1 VOC family protein [Metabacillus bambusae]